MHLRTSLFNTTFKSFAQSDLTRKLLLNGLSSLVAGGAECPLLSDSEDENPEALQDAHSSGPLNHYSLCDQPQRDLLLPATPPPSPRHPCGLDMVVISQPAPLSSPHQPSAYTHPHSSESVRVCLCSYHST